ncbi:MAG: hypothetical protein JWO56_3240 [Acidobacteria bacterium]|nr:hypothetical protein [Acidobacteriota bacterium]
MSMQVKRVLVQQSVTADGGSTAPPSVPPSPQPQVDYAALAAEVNQAIDTMVELLPKFLAAAENSTAFIRRRRNVPLSLVEKAVATVEQNTQLQGLLDLADARDMLSFQQYFRPVFDRMTAATNELGFSLDARTAEVGRASRQVYAVAKSVVSRTPGMIRLAAHVEAMKPDVQPANRPLTPEQVAAKAVTAANRAAAKAAKAKVDADLKIAKAKHTPTPTPVPSPGVIVGQQ